LKRFNTTHIPIIPSIGNWDTFPSNQLSCSDADDGLQKIWKIWKPLFANEDPETFSNIQSTFLKGGFFSKTVIPDTLTVLSVNTLSFFVSNGMVTDCTPIKYHDSGFGDLEPLVGSTVPGDVQLLWLDSQLKQARKDGRKVIVIGHVPPVTHDGEMYKYRCLDGYSYLSGEYSDVILYVSSLSICS
jgi:hypothetical protein